MKKDARIYVAGHTGLVGSAVTRELKKQSYTNIITRTRRELNLLNSGDVENFFESQKPEYVFLCAAKVGGILANITFPAQFIYDNLQIQNNIIHSSFLNKIKKLVFLGSSCIYPKSCPQPIKEEYLLDGKLESTNEPYAISKIAGITMCQSYNKQYGTFYICAIPTNVYGPNDNFHPEFSHVIPGLISRIHYAKIKSSSSVLVWGTGNAQREFIYVDDLAQAVVYLMQNYQSKEIINIGTGKGITIKELVNIIYRIIGYKGILRFNEAIPDGIKQKLLDVSRLEKIGWKAKTSLKTGLQQTYNWYLGNIVKITSQKR